MDTGESSEAKAKKKEEPENEKKEVDSRKKRLREEAKKRRKFKDNEKGREYLCALCSSTFYTVAQYNIHIQSYEHRKRKITKSTSSGEGAAGGGGANSRRIVHCRVCNVYTNSAKQLAEHLGGARHKQLCFRFNVPLTTLAFTPENTSTLEGTKLYGSKLVCKCCNVELNSMQQYDEHMKSKNHKLRAENKPLRPERKLKKALAPFYKDVKKGKGEDSKDSKKDGDSKKVKEAAVKSEDQGNDSKTSKMRKKYELDLLDTLSTRPSDRNEKLFHKRLNVPKPPPKAKPLPFMCDICQEFMNSAFELNEHLMGDNHKKKVRSFISGKKDALESSRNAEDDTPKEESEMSKEETTKIPALYCEACQLMLPSEGSFKEHCKGKKHKFLVELKKGKLSSGAPQTDNKTKKSCYCDVCQLELETEEKMKEHTQSKKHKFLLQLKKPAPGANLGPGRPSGKQADKSAQGNHSESGKRKQDDDRHESRSRDHEGRKKVKFQEMEEIPPLAALALERRELQKELAKRRKEIEEQKLLVEELRRKSAEEEEKRVLQQMISECRQLIEEKQRREARQYPLSRGGDMPPDVGSPLWNLSPPMGSPVSESRSSFEGSRPIRSATSVNLEPLEEGSWGQHDAGLRRAVSSRRRDGHDRPARNHSWERDYDAPRDGYREEAEWDVGLHYDVQPEMGRQVAAERQGLLGPGPNDVPYYARERDWDVEQGYNAQRETDTRLATKHRGLLDREPDGTSDYRKEGNQGAEPNYDASSNTGARKSEERRGILGSVSDGTSGYGEKQNWGLERSYNVQRGKGIGPSTERRGLLGHAPDDTLERGSFRNSYNNSPVSRGSDSEVQPRLDGDRFETACEDDMSSRSGYSAPTNAKIRRRCLVELPVAGMSISTVPLRFGSCLPPGYNRTVSPQRYLSEDHLPDTTAPRFPSPQRAVDRPALSNLGPQGLRDRPLPQERVASRPAHSLLQRPPETWAAPADRGKYKPDNPRMASFVPRRDSLILGAKPNAEVKREVERSAVGTGLSSYVSLWSKEVSIPLLDTPVNLPEHGQGDLGAGDPVQGTPKTGSNWEPQPLVSGFRTSPDRSEKPYGSDTHGSGMSWAGEWKQRSPLLSTPLETWDSSPGGPSFAEKPSWGDYRLPVSRAERLWESDTPHIPGLDFV